MYRAIILSLTALLTLTSAVAALAANVTDVPMDVKSVPDVAVPLTA